IVIQATPRDGSTARKLLIQPGSTVTVVNLPHGQGGMDFNTHVNPPVLKNHMFLYNKLIASNLEFCSRLPQLRDSCSPDVKQAVLHPGPGEGTDAPCSGSGCCSK